jgi:hypothetical protein
MWRRGRKGKYLQDSKADTIYKIVKQDVSGIKVEEWRLMRKDKGNYKLLNEEFSWNRIELV